MSPDLDVIVIGAGAAGLAAAHTLKARGHAPLVLEARDRPGGVMQTAHVDGFVCDRGPNTFRLTGPACTLFERAGLADELVAAEPESRARFLLGPSGLEPVPLGPAALVRSPILSRGGKGRLLKEPFVARGDGAHESVAEFIGRRLGPEAVEKLVGPFLVGVYAGDETRLGAAAVFPALVEYERQAGSIVAGALRSAFRRSSAPRGRAGSFSGRRGVGELAGTLAAALGPGAVEAGVAVDALEPLATGGRGWRVHAGDRTWTSHAVVLAVEAPSAGPLLAPLDAGAAAMCAAIQYAPMASICLDVDPGSARRRIEGFGFLVPGAAELRLLGALFMSRLFPGRAPQGRELVTAMIGGLRWPEAVDASDGTLLAHVHEGLDRALGTGDAPRPLLVNRWPRAVPQPDRDHVGRVRSLRAALDGLPPIALAGGWLDGVAVSGAFGSGLSAGARVADALQRDGTNGRSR